MHLNALLQSQLDYNKTEDSGLETKIQITLKMLKD